MALDVARMLLSPIERLEPTDIGPEALAALRSQPTERVHILVRRGREDAAFTPRELAGLQALAGDRLTLHFHTEVARFEGTERVERVITKAGETLEAGLVVTAIGFASDALPGVPHDPERNVVRTEEGRVVDATGAVCPGVYASGWVRRGPRGIIGRNKEDAEQVVALLLADLPDAPRCPAGDLKALLEARGVRVVDEADYDRLRREERLAGSRENRWAVRRTDTAALLASLDEGARLGGAP